MTLLQTKVLHAKRAAQTEFEKRLEGRIERVIAQEPFEDFPQDFKGIAFEVRQKVSKEQGYILSQRMLLEAFWEAVRARGLS